MIASRERNPERSRERLLQAALAEFAEKGYAGARVESIARRSGLNKQLISHHFGGKRNLYRAVMNRRRRSNGGEISSDPGPLPDALATLNGLAASDPEWIRVLLWETLERGALEGDSEPTGPTDDDRERGERYRDRVGWIAAEQAAGRLPDDLEPDLLLLSLFGAALYPLLLPAPAALIAGEDVTTASFAARYQDHLRRLAGHLSTKPGRRSPTA
jgi:TetR/AcrR family transcriptional regulator